MKLMPFLSHMNHPYPNPSSSWQWPSCGGETRTLSFRAPPEPTKTDADDPSGDSVEKIIRGLSSERLFFDPGESSSILTKTTGGIPYEQSIAMELDSMDPCADFRKSMEEMVEAHGLKDWEALEELLSCYLKVNCKSNHVYIVSAFVDLLLTLPSFLGESSSSYSPSSSSKSFTVSPTSPLSLS